MNRLTTLRNRLEQRKGMRKILQERIRKNKDEFKTAEKEALDIEEGKNILQTIAQKCQKELEFYISDIVTVALNTVFEDPYEFVIDFVPRRGSMEADLFFVRDGHRINPLDSSGIGAVDIAAFALRLAVWRMDGACRNVLILDEPFKHLKGIETNRKAIQIIKILSDKLGLQIIMISDEKVPLEEIEKGADKIFKVSIKDRVTQIEEL